MCIVSSCCHKIFIASHHWTFDIIECWAFGVIKCWVVEFWLSMLLNVELSTFSGVEDWAWSYVKCWASLAWRAKSFLFKKLLHKFQISFICVQQFVVFHVWLYTFSLLRLCSISFHHYLFFCFSFCSIWVLIYELFCCFFLRHIRV